MSPLVSVIIPCYNSVKTLPVTLASLIAQTYTNWECIIVDDGSIDNPIAVVRTINDNRIRFHRFEYNQGRAVARQQALEMASGDYLCMVDADDWIYPWKIERQVEVMETNPKLALVSAGMVLVDSDNNLLGVRLLCEEKMIICPPLQRPQPLPIAHAPSMIRIDCARSSGYDSRFRRTEDMDFLLRVLMEHPFAIMGEPLYAYAEHQSLNWHDIMTSQLNAIRVFYKYLPRFPVITLRNVSISCIKLISIMMIQLLGKSSHYGHLRPMTLPTARQSQDFNIAQRQIHAQESIDVM